MAASAATTYDPTQDEGGSENSDVELDVELQQELPNREDFRGAVAAVGQRGTVCAGRIHCRSVRGSAVANTDCRGQ